MREMGRGRGRERGKEREGDERCVMCTLCRLKNSTIIAMMVRVGQLGKVGGQLVVWLRCRPVDRMVAGSIPDSTNFLTNSFGQATNALVSLFTKQ